MLSMLMIGGIDGEKDFSALLTFDEWCTEAFDAVSISSCVTTIRGTAAGLLCASIFCLLKQNEIEKIPMIVEFFMSACICVLEEQQFVRKCLSMFFFFSSLRSSRLIR